MRAWVRCQFLLTSALLMAVTLSCTQWRAQYLDEALNHATQTEIAQRFGQPSETDSFADGTTMWLYQARGGTAPPPKSDGDPYCKEYRLIFDADKILRHWEASRC